MKTRIRGVFLAALCVLILLAILLFRKPVREVSLLFVHGRVHTVRAEEPAAEAVAIDGGTIVGVGSTEDIVSHFRGAKTIDLRGRSVYPGFIDSHAHLEELGVALQYLDLSGALSMVEVTRRVAGEVAGRPAGSWIRGRGWDQYRWKDKGYPSAGVLDAVAPRNPVYLTRADGHAVWVNTMVLHLTGISRATRDPEGGKIVRGRNGAPTGIFIDNAIGLLNSMLPEPDREERIRSILKAMHECLRFGLTEVHDMGVDGDGVDLYRSLMQEGRLPFRVYVALESVKSLWDSYRASGPVVGAYDGRLTVRAINLTADGTLGSRSAALIEPYADDPGNRGMTLTAAKELREVVQEAFDAGFQVCVNAVGDRANTMVLDAYSDVLKGGRGDRRFRIEHAEVLDPADIPRFHQVGVLPIMQPTQCTSDMPWAGARLGPKRIPGACAWRSLLETGSIVPAGSDFPVESPNPLLGFYAAITREDTNGKPEGGWHPEQRMTREEALKAFTIWGAFAGFQENVLGTIAPGKWADLVVLSDDIMVIPAPRIPSVSVFLTMVGGTVVYATNVEGLVAGTEQPATRQ